MLFPLVYITFHYIIFLDIITVCDIQYDAIGHVHQHLDDDNDGIINELESSDFINKELSKEISKTNRPNLNRDDDRISVDDLWQKWKQSSVYKWNVDDVVRWLKETVKLPQYEKNFREKKVRGLNVPQLATKKAKYVQQELKIAESNHRMKIYLRASDLILFGHVENGKNEKFEDKNYWAIVALHRYLDDDHDGEIDKNESSEYYKDELNGSNTQRSDSFHGKDNHISVDEFWERWQLSTVHNWTTNDVVVWLKDIVGLPQYERNFRDNNIDGKSIPRLAIDNTTSSLFKEIGISNSTHRRKFSLRASDIILFGVPEVQKNYFSDTMVALTFALATSIFVYAIQQKRVSQKQTEQLITNQEYLKQAEQMLKELQDSENDSSLKAQELEEAKKEAERLYQEQSKYESEKTKLQLVEQELSELRAALAKAESEMKYNEIRSPSALQHLLIITYRKESQYFQQRKQQALSQMQEAKEACDKVNKTKRAVFGSLRLAHGQSIDVVDQKILNAKSALAEVTKSLQERQHRWQQIEFICNFNIINEENYVNGSGKNLLSKVLLSDDMSFGSKTRLDLLDSQIAAISENEMLDNEVETIIQRGKLMRQSTESSSSQESIHTKNMPNQSSPVQLDKTPKTGLCNINGSSLSTDDSNVINGNSSVSPGIEMNQLTSSATCPNIEKLLDNDDKRSPVEKIYNRANTEPGTHTRTASLRDVRSAENVVTPNEILFRSSSKKEKGSPRPMSMVEAKSIKKSKKLLSLSRLSNSSQ